MNKELDVVVKDLLAARKGHWQLIVEQSGVSHSWLSKFANGRIPNPGYATLKRLHECLNDAQAPAECAQAATETVAAQGA